MNWVVPAASNFTGFSLQPPRPERYAISWLQMSGTATPLHTATVVPGDTGVRGGVGIS